MSNDIPTTPQANPVDTVLAALAHGISGHPEKAAPLFEPFVLGGPASSVSLCAALAEAATFHSRQTLPKGGMFGLLVLDATTGARADINVLSPGIRFAAQFASAWSNGERDTAYALFHALIEPETDEAAEAFGDGLRALFDMAVASLTHAASRRS